MEILSHGVNSCNDSSTSLGSFSILLGDCASGSMIECVGDDTFVEHIYENDDCTGAVLHEFDIFNGQCFENTDTNVFEAYTWSGFTCPTQEPTLGPSFAPSANPIMSHNECPDCAAENHDLFTCAYDNLQDTNSPCFGLVDQSAYDACVETECQTEILAYEVCFVNHGCVFPSVSPTYAPVTSTTLNPSASPSMAPSTTTTTTTMSPTRSPTQFGETTTEAPIEIVQYTQSFSGIASDKCAEAVPYIREATALTLGRAIDEVTVTPSTGCDTTNRRRLSESNGVEFIIEVEVTEEVKSVITSMVEDTETFKATLTSELVTVIANSGDADAVADFTTIAVDSTSAVLIVTTTTTTVEPETTVVEILAEEEEAASSGGAAAGGAVGAIFVLGLFAMWYFGYLKKIKDYCFNSKKEEEFTDIYEEEEDVKEKVEIHSASNVNNEQNNKYRNEDGVDVERPAHVSPKKVPSNQKNGRVIL